MFHSRKPRPVDDKVLQKLDAQLARTCLNGGQMDTRMLRSVLADVGIGATAAVTVDAVIDVV